MIAVLYPGQGSQTVGMGAHLMEISPLARQTFEEASDTLGFDLKKLCLEGPEDQLTMTENTQPALLTVSVATFKVLNEVVGLDDVLGSAGHSVGEYAALVNAKVLPFAKAVELVRLRGQLMQQTVPLGEGGMLAVLGLSPEDVERLCQWTEEASGLGPVEPANFNCPGQVVVSGKKAALDWLCKNLDVEAAKLNTGKKPKLIPLKVSAPFHCSMMKVAERELSGAIKDVEFRAPLHPVAQNYTGSLEADPEVLKDNLIRQVSGPVRWVECMQALSALKIQSALELGPGRVLSGLIKKMDLPDWTSFSFNSADDIKNFQEHLQTQGANT